MNKASTRNKLKQELYQASVVLYGSDKARKQKSEDAPFDASAMLRNDVIDLFPSAITSKLLNGTVNMCDDAADNNGLMGICKHPSISGVQENDYYDITVVNPGKRKTVACIREWKSVYDLAGHAIAHIFDTEFDNVSNDASFRRVFNKETYLFEGDAGTSPAEFFAESAWCFLRYNEIFKKYSLYTARWMKRWFDAVALDRLMLDFKLNGEPFPSIRPLIEGNYSMPHFKAAGLGTIVGGSKSKVSAKHAKSERFGYINTQFYDFLCDEQQRLTDEFNHPIKLPDSSFVDNLVEAGQRADEMEYLHQKLVNANDAGELAEVEAAMVELENAKNSKDSHSEYVMNEHLVNMIQIAEKEGFYDNHEAVAEYLAQFDGNAAPDDDDAVVSTDEVETSLPVDNGIGDTDDIVDEPSRTIIINDDDDDDLIAGAATDSKRIGAARGEFTIPDDFTLLDDDEVMELLDSIEDEECEADIPPLDVVLGIVDTEAETDDVDEAPAIEDEHIVDAIVEPIDGNDDNSLDTDIDYTVEDIQMGCATSDTTDENNAVLSEMMSDTDTVKQEMLEPTGGWDLKELRALADEIESIRESAAEEEVSPIAAPTPKPLELPVITEEEIAAEATRMSEDTVKEMTADLIAETIVDKIDDSNNDPTQPIDIPKEVEEEARDKATDTLSFTKIFVDDEVKEKLEDQSVETLEIIMDNVTLTDGSEDSSSNDNEDDATS